MPARDLAQDAGLSVATLYRHFPTRQDLVAAMYTDQILACDAVSKWRPDGESILNTSDVMSMVGGVARKR